MRNELYGIFREITADKFDKYYNVTTVHEGWVMVKGRVFSDLELASSVAKDMGESSGHKYVVRPLEVIN